MTSVSHSIIIRLDLFKTVGGRALSKVMNVISELGGDVGAIDIVKAQDDKVTRDISIATRDDEHAQTIVDAIGQIPHVEVKHVSDRVFLLHLNGKIEIKSKIPITHRDDLSMAYTPGVGRVCMAIHNEPEKARTLTIKHNTVAVVTDGTAVLGLGDIGPLAALPVMEGKAMLFKEFANVDAFPICLDTKDPDEIVKTVQHIAPSFGAINLEDISAPRCFYIEQQLKKALNIPVFHDDQHGTAIAMTAALINALKLVGKTFADIKVVLNGVGAAGTACTYMLLELGIRNIIGCDRQGALTLKRENLDPAKHDYAQRTNPNQESGSLYDVIRGADVFVGLSAPNILSVDDIKKMNKDAIVFAMANPIPEIMPEEALPHVAIMATGRSDYPNQINNLLAFPGIFRGVFDCQATDITQQMNIAAAHAIANIIDETTLARDYIIPSVFNHDVVHAVAEAVINKAREQGLARK